MSGRATTETPGATEKTSNPITKKLAKILDSKIETDQEMLESLETVSEFFEDNTYQNRRNLRREIERRSLETNMRFIESFRKVKEHLEQLSGNVSAMHSCCEAMSSRLKDTKEQTRDLINQTTRLQGESKRVEKRAEVVSAFLGAFQLKTEESQALKGTPEGGIKMEFFPALARVKQIHADCKHLLRSTQHAAALEIMENMASQHEAAYELLYRWIQRECRLLNVDFVELNPLLCEAFQAMQERPVLFKYSLDEFSTARRNNMVRGFIDALTRGGAGGLPKPIELLSHDPLRYVGDMLAWIHQTMATERETLQLLLRLCQDEVKEEHTVAVLSHITEGLCRPFKIRVEQSLTSESGPVALYRLSNLFTFYSDTMKPVLGAESQLVHSVDELKDLTKNMFFSSLTSHIHKLLTRIEPPGPDLLPVQGLHQVLLLLRDVLESHDSTLVPVLDKKENFARILNAVLDPLHQSLQLSATHLSSIELAVYMLNCLNSVHSLLALYQYTDDRLEMLNAQMEAHEDVLVSEQAGSIFARTAMNPVYQTALHHQHQQGPMSELPAMDSESVNQAMAKFDLFLSKPDSYNLAQCNLLTSSKIRESVVRSTMETIGQAYGVITAKLTEPDNAYQNLTFKTEAQIRDLLC